ncbi:MAG TPA: peptidoglycan-binding protein [Pyrinomonadaceae bacterium]|nr:peptidoglycan-binding protein [Pyrinomonadaceae bacterium]
MQTLKLGSEGADVVKLQERLKALGFNPGRVDGDFGPGTEAAVIAFQRSEELLADGVVGVRTLKALGFEPAPEAVLTASAVQNVSVGVVSRMFPHTPLDNIKKNLPFVLEALEECGLTDKRMVLMALATVRAETESFRPIDEGKSRFNTSPGGRPFDLYDRRKDLGNQGPPDGSTFKGRGYIQLTGRENYRVIGSDIGMGRQLLDDPALANKPDVAAKVLAFFLKRKERAIKEALAAGDLRTARKLVNGGSHGLDRFVESYRIGDALLT